MAIFNVLFGTYGSGGGGGGGSSSGYMKKGTTSFSNGVLAITGLPAEPTVVFASASDNYEYVRRSYYIKGASTTTARMQTYTIAGIVSHNAQNWVTLTDSASTGYHWDAATGTFYIRVRETDDTGTSAWYAGAGDLAAYIGTYNVIPSSVLQTLSTDDTVLTDNVTVQAIPYVEEDNLSGGKTATIG